MAVDVTKIEGTRKKELHIFYVLDTSGSMTGAPIGALNDAMRATVEELRKIDGDKADLRIGVLEYNSAVNWVTKGNNGLEEMRDFFWTDLHATGMTKLGGALRDLDASLSRNDKMHSASGNKVPIVIFMSDGYPNDDWEGALQKIAANKWYRSAIKIAFALGDDADGDVLAKVVGVRKDGSISPDYEAVIQTNDLQTFASMIEVVSVSSTLAATTSIMVGAELQGRDIVKEGVGTYQGGDTSPVVPTPDPTDLYVDPDPNNDPFGQLI